MKQRPLPGTKISVSSIGLGTWAMGGGVAVWGQVDDRESIAAVHAAIDSGINLIDTAPVYGRGHSEEILGKAIQGRREQLVLATKCGLLPAVEGDAPRRCLTRETILRECDASLRRLKVNQIDIYQCHWPDPQTPLRETMGALAELVEQEAIRAVGLSNFSCEQLRAALEFGPVHAIQVPFSILQPRAGWDLIPFCVEHGIAVLAYSPLCKGLLTGKFGRDDSFDGVRGRDPDYVGNRYHRNLRLVEVMRTIAGEYGKSPAQLAINWVTNYPGVTSALMGAKRSSQVAENVGAAGWTLSPEHQARIQELAGALGRDD